LTTKTKTNPPTFASVQTNFYRAGQTNVCSLFFDFLFTVVCTLNSTEHFSSLLYCKEFLLFSSNSLIVVLTKTVLERL
jgi:hypothetical protein